MSIGFCFLWRQLIEPFAPPEMATAGCDLTPLFSPVSWLLIFLVATAFLAWRSHNIRSLKSFLLAGFLCGFVADYLLLLLLAKTLPTHLAVPTAPNLGDYLVLRLPLAAIGGGMAGVIIGAGLQGLETERRERFFTESWAWLIATIFALFMQPGLFVGFLLTTVFAAAIGVNLFARLNKKFPEDRRRNLLAALLMVSFAVINYIIIFVSLLIGGFASTISC